MRDLETAALILRDTLNVAGLEIAEDTEQRFVVRGVANSFGVMRSGRIIHPNAVADWLKQNPGATLPFMVLHGQGGGGFATIGRVESLAADPKRGLVFTASVAAGTQLADEARSLVRQGFVGAISLGWYAKQARWVTLADADLDPHLREAMKRAGVSEAHAHMKIEPVEVSLVDVADDPAAKLAARHGQQGGDGTAAAAAEIATLRTEVASLQRQLARIESAGGVEAAALAQVLWDRADNFIEQVRDEIISALWESPELLEAARAHRDATAGLLSQGDHGAAHLAAGLDADHVSADQVARLRGLLNGTTAGVS